MYHVRRRPVTSRSGIPDRIFTSALEPACLRDLQTSRALHLWVMSLQVSCEDGCGGTWVALQAGGPSKPAGRQASNSMDSLFRHI
jgi:hypothetical protein